jgi:RimJ/RimL family protein N-acetyltransferase
MKILKENILTERFFIRELEISDASEKYFSWFSDDEGLKFITNKPTSKNALEEYLAVNINRKDVLFLGIFSRNNGEHIGNLKFEKISRNRDSAVVGFLLGCKEYRGTGVIYEVFLEVLKFLYCETSLRFISLGLDGNNIAALNLYKKMGFIEGQSVLIPHVDDGHLTMNLDVHDLLDIK